MHLTLKQSDLHAALSALMRIVPSKSTLPILSNVLLAAEGGRLKLAATNLELAITTRIPADVAAEGAITLPARVLAEWVGLLNKDERITFERASGKRLRVALRCGRYESTIAGIEAEDWPPLPNASDLPTATLPAALLKAAIAQVAFAAAREDSRPVLAGVLLAIEDNALTLAAADGFRLAIRTLPLDDAGAPAVRLIVPAKALTELGRALPDTDDATVAVATTANRTQVLFTAGDVELVSRLIEGQFPDYARIIPTEPKTTATLPTAELLRATKAATVFARDNSMIVKLDFLPSAVIDGVSLGAVTVKATGAETGDTAAVLDARCTGEEQHVAFNGRYLRDALEALGTDEVKLEIVGPALPGIIRPVGGDVDYTHVIMPMHVADQQQAKATVAPVAVEAVA